MANWLDKYEQGGLVLKKKTKDNYGKKENANAGYSTAGPGWVGEGTTNRGFNYNGAWGGTMQNGGKLTLPEAIVYGHKDPNTKTYFNKVRGIAENYQDKNFWLTPLAGYHALEQMYSKYGAPKINTIGEDDRPHYNPFINTINIPEPTKDNGGNWSSDVFLDELAHKVQSNKKGNTGFIKDHVGKDLLNTLKNIDSSRIFTKNGWLDAYRKNYFTPGTQEYEAHSVIQPKLQTEYREIREKQFDRLYGDMAMGGTMPGATGMMYARTQDPAPSNGPYAKKTKASAQNGTEMKYYQEGLDFKPKSISQDGKTIPNEKEEIKPITTSQRNIGQAAAWKVIEAIKANTPYQLSESAVKSGIDPSLTCIGGVCNVYKDLGVDFSGVGNEKQGVRESRTKGKVVEYNPTFDKNYKAAGFEKVKGRPIEFNELTDIIQKGNLNPGDFIQYYNKKGIPDHTNIVLGSNPDGSVEVYNSYKHGQVTRGESKEPYVYTLNPEAQDYKGKKINVFRVGDQKATEIRDASANNPSGITNTWFNYNMEKAIQRRMKILEKDYQELAKQSGEPAKKLTPSQLRKAAIEEERRIYESDPMFKRNLERINTVDFSESPQEAMYRTLNKQKNGGWLDNYSEPIRDDRGQWAYPGEVTEIGSNEITMQGVEYPVLGISDTGDRKMMYPGKDYKFDGNMVTEYPLAQDGKKLKNVKGKSEKFLKEWMDSPMYNKMVNESIKKSPNTNDEILKQISRQDQLDRMIKNPKSFITGDLNSDKPWYDFDRIEGEYNRDNYNITIDKNIDNDKLFETAVHELSHATDLAGANIPRADVEKMWKYQKQREQEKGKLTKFFDNEDFNTYVGRPTETRARLNSIRALGKEQGVYNPFTEKIDKSKLDKIKSPNIIRESQLDQLRKIYNDDQIIDLLNSVSKNDSNKLIPQAQDGGWLNKYK